MLQKVISGGQTGVDRAGLDAAMEAGITVGGWCPKGRQAEDGIIPSKYPLTEIGSTSYSQRTEKNIRESDATLILAGGELTGGTLLTHNLAKKSLKPYLVVDLGAEPDAESVQSWLDSRRVRVLNVAGPRESMNPGIHGSAMSFLAKVFSTSLGK